MVSGREGFDPASPCLVIAPHLEYPIRSGADILIDRKYAHFSEHVPFVDIIGKEAIVRYSDGKPVQSTPYKNVRVGKAVAAAATLYNRSHYLLEKFVTRDFVETMRRYFSDPDYRMVVFSFVWTAAIARRLPKMDDRLCCIETHNDEFKWYEDIRKSSVNPLAKLTASFSERWARSFVEEYGSGFLFLHVSEADQKGFSRRFPDHRSCVVPTGADMTHDRSFPQENLAMYEKTRLIFVGSLGVKINFDALDNFNKRFYPVLKEELEENLEVLIVGSNPSRRVTKLCWKAGWKLHPNVSDQELRRLYGISTFSILPFNYTTGSKLKLLDSLAHGVPYLATSSLRDQAEEEIYPCLVSNDPKEWSERARDVGRRGITEEERVLLKDQAQRHSWKSIARLMFEMLSRDQCA